jgi:hypothetical protein
VGTKKQKLGIYPCPTRPFQELNMDLLENLNPIKGFENILVVQCSFSDFILLYPMKTKTASELAKIFLYNIFQAFNIEKIHTDNGPLFRNQEFLATASALGIKVIASASLHPSGRGQVERTVGLVKRLLKKFLATNKKQDLNWELLPICVSKAYNNIISPKTNFRPVEMVFGSEGGRLMTDIDSYAPPHYLVKNNATYIKELNKKIQEITKEATKNIIDIRAQRVEHLNKSRISSTFKVGDYVFSLDTTRVPGSSRVLKTTINPSPYIVVRPLYTTTLVRRLADGFTTLYPNKMLKLYVPQDEPFKDLPDLVKRVLLNQFQDLLEQDMSDLTKADPLNLPNGVALFQSENDSYPKLTGKNDSAQGKSPLPLDDLDSDNEPWEIDDDLNELQDELKLDSTLLNPQDNDSDDSDAESPRYNLRNRVAKRVQFQQ